jgi:hypothetical protein
MLGQVPSPHTTLPGLENTMEKKPKFVFRGKSQGKIKVK